MTRGSQIVEKSPRLDRADWVRAAREAFIKGGEARVKVEPLAVTIGVTTGSFYWHFKNRQELLAEVLDDWQATNSAALINAVRTHEGDPDRQLDALAEVWIGETSFNPAYDSAMRDWARMSPKVDRIVRRIDEQRISLIQEIFNGLGYEGVEALVRARITYFHQVGYYTLHIKEGRADRLRLKDVYLRALKGTP
jgi:AcrR family transcriptional regulator